MKNDKYTLNEEQALQTLEIRRIIALKANVACEKNPCPFCDDISDTRPMTLSSGDQKDFDEKGDVFSEWYYEELRRLHEE